MAFKLFDIIFNPLVKEFATKTKVQIIIPREAECHFV